MEQEANESIGWEPFVGRGFLGGSLGGLSLGIGAAVYVQLRIGSDSLALTAFAPPLFAAIAGGIEGMAIGYVVFWWSHRYRKVPNVFTRILIGSLCLFIYSLLTGLISKGTIHYFFNLGEAVLVGGVSGLLARDLSSRL